MAKITQKQLISQIKGLEAIKPNQEWAFSLKSQILFQNKAEFADREADRKTTGIMDAISSVFFQKRVVYAFATVLFFAVGVLGFAQYTMPGDLLFPIKKIAEQSQVSLMGKTLVSQNAELLSNRINDLAQVAKEGRTESIPSVISEIAQNASQLAQSLKNEQVKDPEAIKEIASSLKVLASVPGTDLSQSEDVRGLYEVVVSSQIADLEKTTLTEKQEEILQEAKKLHEEGKCTEALEQILLINN